MIQLMDPLSSMKLKIKDMLMSLHRLKTIRKAQIAHKDVKGVFLK